MQRNDLVKSGERILRILAVREDSVCVVDCLRKTVPTWIDLSEIESWQILTEEDFRKEMRAAGELCRTEEELTAEEKKIMHQRFTMVAGILPVVTDRKKRLEALELVAEQNGISKLTLKRKLCLYLAYQDVAILAPAPKKKGRELTQDEKNIRWALNKYYYTRARNSLDHAYTMMLKEKYCDPEGKLLADYPSFHQFKYYFRHHKKLLNYYISREGIKSYERNHRPVVGVVQDYASYIGMAMFDSTICDIYLVNDAGQLIGRPILTAAVDGYSGMCIGYFLSWEGGVYSLRNLIANILEDKQKHCLKHGIRIEPEQWPSNKLPGVFVTDMGTEYVSGTFEQITELGVIVENLPAYRPDLKGNIEKFFDLIQSAYKPNLKRKGLIEPDYQERAAPDYRKDACLTLNDFEKILLQCILYYNNQRIMGRYPYTKEMLSGGVKPYASQIYLWGLKNETANLIEADIKTAMLTLLPRTEGKFSRHGFKVNGLRYHAEGFTEEYLKGGTGTAAYNPDDSTIVWLLRAGIYTEFQLVEVRYQGMSLHDIEELKAQQRAVIREAERENRQAKIDLSRNIQDIAGLVAPRNINLRDIRDNRQKERLDSHTDPTERGYLND